MELDECVLKQCEAQPALAPRPPHAEHADPTAAVLLGVAANTTGDLVSVTCDEPERRIRIRRTEAHLLPFLERERDEPPLLLERLVHRRVEGSGIFPPKPG